ncbi:hypothetical protein [Ornithinimicrobium sediminis]|uniref:hypothetical protein n=1 Tax=Ornithinimicrobium sediminis TaxID=2904603 RepID=UPI001E518AC2|nr:hypothetical protein [Ornithinimicrobium sediminis]MCE0487368.1 hypothetical protein [Ornithinimicrobium sediminis]
MAVHWEVSSVGAESISLVGEEARIFVARDADPSDSIDPDASFTLWLPEEPEGEHAFEMRTYPEERRWTDDWIGWVITGRLLWREPSWIITELSIRADRDSLPGLPPMPATAITAHVLREVRLGLIYSAMSAIARGLPADPRFTFEDVLEFAGPVGAARLERISESRQPRPGRPRRSPREFRRFVETALHLGGSHELISQELDWPVETVRTWLKAARREEWLAPGQPGRRGVIAPGPRYLTDKGKMP